MKKKIEIQYELVSQENLTDTEQKLINAAEQAILTSHAPYSNFHVGAALLLDNDQVIAGSNQENAAYPVGYCAERTAIAAKIASAPAQKIVAIAIAILNKAASVLPPIAPCGMCRQALLEEAHRQKLPIKAYLVGNNGQIMVIESIEQLLPFQFDETILLGKNPQASP